MKTFKVLGLLMSYPKPDWISHLDECERILAGENLLRGRQLRGVRKFIAMLSSADIYDLQEEYVTTFDRGRSHCLHLFEHVHGESRDRGQAMVNLATAYEEKGFYIDQAELPDYIPLFLEFLSLCPADEAVTLLGEPVDILATIAARLGKKKSPWSVLFDALVALSKTSPNQASVSDALAEGDEDDSLEALDKQWEEAAAFAGPPDQSGCGGCTTQADGLNVKVI
jgi:nitrate reductase delta subunit